MPSFLTLARIIRVIANIAIVIASALLQASEKGRIIPSYVVSFVRDHGWWIILLSTLGIWTTTWWVSRSYDPKVNEILRTLLTEFRDRVFPDVEGRHADHRVTVFAHRRFYWKGILRWKNPWSGWLVPFVRPGHTAQRTGAFFWAPDDPSKAEGIVGKAWVDNTAKASAVGLPDMRVPKPDVYAYAGETNVPPAVVRRRRPDVRSLIAFVVKKPTGEHWGVLVVDSKKPLLDTNRVEETYGNYEAILARIVNVL